MQQWRGVTPAISYAAATPTSTSSSATRQLTATGNAAATTSTSTTTTNDPGTPRPHAPRHAAAVLHIAHHAHDHISAQVWRIASHSVQHALHNTASAADCADISLQAVAAIELLTGG